MKFLLCLVGLLGMLMLFQSEKEQQEKVAGNFENNISVSQGDVLPFSAIENPKTNFSFCNPCSRLPMQKRGTDDLNPTIARRVAKTEIHISKEEYILHKSTSLFLVYQYSISLWRVLRR
jgi:hypothetical protein